MIEFRVLGRIPSKKNSKQIFKSKRGKPFISSSDAYKKWHRGAVYQLITQNIKRDKLLCEEIKLEIYFPCKRKADLTNKAESVMDLLVDFGVIHDDNWQSTGTMILVPHYDKENPRVEVLIKEVIKTPTK